MKIVSVSDYSWTIEGLPEGSHAWIVSAQHGKFVVSYYYEVSNKSPLADMLHFSSFDEASAHIIQKYVESRLSHGSD